MFQVFYLSLVLFFAIEFNFIVKSASITVEDSGEGKNVVELRNNLLQKKDTIVEKCLSSHKYGLADFIKAVYEKVAGSEDKETIDGVFKIYDCLEETLSPGSGNLVVFIIKDIDITSLLNEELMRNSLRFSKIEVFRRIGIMLDVFKRHQIILIDELNAIIKTYKEKRDNLLVGFKRTSPEYIYKSISKENLRQQLKDNPEDTDALNNMLRELLALEDHQRKIESYADELYKNLQGLVSRLEKMRTEAESFLQTLNKAFDRSYSQEKNEKARKIMIEERFSIYLKIGIKNLIINGLNLCVFNKDAFLERIKKFEISETEQTFNSFKNDYEEMREMKETQKANP